MKTAFTLWLAVGFLLGANPAWGAEKPLEVSPLDSTVPEDSFLTLSLRLGKLLEKAEYAKLKHWLPTIENNRGLNESLKAIVRDPRKLGINLKSPTHVFAQVDVEGGKGLILGILASVTNKEALNGHLDALGENFGIEPKKSKGVSIRSKSGLPFLFAQRGRLLLVLFAAPSAMDSPLVQNEEKPSDISDRLNLLAHQILDARKKANPPSPLQTHLQRPYDLSFYFNYENFARFALSYSPDPQFERIIKTLRALSGNLSITTQFFDGRFDLKLQHLPKDGKSLFRGPVDPKLVASLPGDAIAYGGISINRQVLEDIFDSLTVKEEKTAEKEASLPAFSTKDMIDAFDGDLVFALSHHRKVVPILTEEVAFPDWAEAPNAFFLGAKIGNPRKLDLLMATANENNLFDYLLASSGLSRERKDNHLFFTTPDHRREIRTGKPVRPLSKKQRRALSEGPLLVHFDFKAYARSLRESIPAHYEFLMSMDVLEEFEQANLSAEDNGDLLLRIHLRDKKRNALATLAKRLETEFTDRKNTNLFRAIAQNNLREVDQEVRTGALINAPDRSGHTPMHFAAYRGSPEVFHYLLRNGGLINLQGRDKGTPLHSATWGRNVEVVKLLLENGADVNAKTEEGETPAMTAALRGEQEILEIFLSLAADPKARDKHDTGLLELAAAGGHAKIVDRLKAIGVKTKYPLHVAAGLGDKGTLSKLLDKGTPVDLLDGFGGTALLFSTISGNREIFDFLLKKKADPKIVAVEGYTLMHAAAFSKDKELISRLLDLGLDINARFGDEGITPLDVAHESPEAVQLLRLHGGKTSWELGRR